MRFTFGSWILVIIFHLSGVQAVKLGSSQVATQGEFNYMVFVMTPYGGCGGSLISENHVLTAGHCVGASTPENVEIIAGTVNLARNVLIRQFAQEIHLHPNYKDMTSGIWAVAQCLLRSSCVGKATRVKHDIAVLKLTTPVPLGVNIGIVHLPIASSIEYCSKCKFAGWGGEVVNGPFSLTLRWMELSVLRPEVCRDLGTPLFDYEICTLDSYTMSCPMKGDSGGPLVCNGVVIGVGSTGTSSPTDPYIFVNVYDHIEFIRNRTAN